MTNPTEAPAPDPGSSLRLRRGETLGSGLRRVTAAQFEVAGRIVASDDPAASVHESRKAIKRLRTLLRLVRPTLPNPVFSADDSTLRATAQILGSIRDEWVVADILGDLATSIPAAGEVAARHRDEFQFRVSGFLADRSAFDRLRIGLSNLATCSNVWYDGTYRAGVGITHSFVAIAPGLHRIYRSGRTAWHSVHTDPTTANLHRWRRRAKYLRHAVEALNTVDPPRLGLLEAKLADLTDRLGDDHDLSVVAARIGTDDALTGDVRSALEVEIDRRRRDLTADAVELGGPLFQPTPDEFGDALATTWPPGPRF